MYLEIVSPEKTLFNGDVDSVLVPGADGSFQINGTVKILGEISDSIELAEVFSKVSSRETHLNITSGVVEMKENKVIILTDWNKTLFNFYITLVF